MKQKNHRKSLRIRLDPELSALLKASAKDNERTVNAEIVFCLKKYLINLPNFRQVTPAELKHRDKWLAESTPLVIPGLKVPADDESHVDVDV